MLKENEAILNNRSHVVKKEEGTIEFSFLLSIFFFKIFTNYDKGLGTRKVRRLRLESKLTAMVMLM